MKSLQKILAARSDTMYCSSNSVEIIRACEDLCWNHDKSTHIEQKPHGITENAVHRAKEVTSALLVQTGLAEKWWWWWRGSDGMLL